MTFPSIIIEGDSKKHLLILLKELQSRPLINNPDIFTIDESSGWGIDIIRLVTHFFSQKPITQTKKICLVYEAQNLSTEAQNALLKILEEPPIHGHLILLTNNHHQLLDTIISRSQLIISPPSYLEPPSIITLPKDITQALDQSIKIFESISKEQLLDWIDSQIIYFQHQLPKNPDSLILKTLIKGRLMHLSHVDPKAVIDYIFLSLVPH
jgi:hypothetical protein